MRGSDFLILLSKRAAALLIPLAFTIACRVQPSLYKPRRPEKTDLHVTIRKNLSKWNRDKELTGFVSTHVQKEFESYLKCGILAHGFARAYCKTCDEEFLLAFSCKHRCICPSCNQKRMVAVATHLVEEVIPKVRIESVCDQFSKTNSTVFEKQGNSKKSTQNCSRGD